MLTLTEKIYAKLLANRIKAPTNKGIDAQQTSFLLGRTITDNLLTYKLAKELITQTKKETVMLKVDFMKAYDHVEHIFIWDLMLAMGFHSKIVQLAKGLVENVESKVHING